MQKKKCVWANPNEQSYFSSQCELIMENYQDHLTPIERRMAQELKVIKITQDWRTELILKHSVMNEALEFDEEMHITHRLSCPRS